VLKDPRTVNAFALPGGPVFITRALLDRLQNEAQLAGVLGHEIGHVVGRHSAEQLSKSQLAQGSSARSASRPRTTRAARAALSWPPWWRS
jgi:predicted Zn-dependent protease